jgi:hypothetical protein
MYRDRAGRELLRATAQAAKSTAVLRKKKHRQRAWRSCRISASFDEAKQMTPKEYLDRYTYLKFYSPWNNAQVPAGISGYGSGWGNRGDNEKLGGQCNTEFAAFRDALRVAHHGDVRTACGARFKFDKTLGLIPASEEFFPETFVHAFNGKGSPDEIIDTLRVAMAIGRIGTDRDYYNKPPAKPTAAEYAAAFMTLDCNGLVGNFYGDNPDGHISNYASPGRRRTAGGNVQVGDCVVTHSATSPYEHIAVIQRWSFNGSTAEFDIVEWGEKGGEEKHYKTKLTAQISSGPEKKFGIGWATKSNKDHQPSFRYIFEPSKRSQPYGWS